MMDGKVIKVHRSYVRTEQSLIKRNLRAIGGIMWTVKQLQVFIGKFIIT